MGSLTSAAAVGGSGALGPWGLLLPAGLGAVESTLGMIGLGKEAKKPWQSYTVSPEMQNAYDRAEQMSKAGYTGSEKSSFYQDLARSNQLRLQRGLEIAGPGLGAAVNAAANSTDVNALNQFAASDEAVRRQNIRYADTLAQAVQRQKNLEVQNQNQRKMMMERAYGGAMKAGLENIANGVGGYAAYKYGGLGRGLGGDETLPNYSGLPVSYGTYSAPDSMDQLDGRPISTPSLSELYGVPATGLIRK